MKNLNLLIASLLTVSFNNVLPDAKQVEKQQEKVKNNKSSPRKTLWQAMDDLHVAFEQEMESMFDMHRSLRKDFFDNDSKFDINFRDTRRVVINNETDKDGNNWVIVTIDLPDTKTAHSNINIQAKDQNLEGHLTYDKYTLKFFVIDGNEFGTSMEYNKEIKDEKDNGKYTNVISALSSQMSTIPQVKDLERTIAEVKDNKLIIKLPGVNSKAGWSTIKVQNHKPVIK